MRPRSGDSLRKWMTKGIGGRLCLFLLVAGTACTREQPFVKVSKADPRYLELGTGETFIPVGPNICFPRRVTEGDSLLSYYDYYFGRLAANGGNFTRIWLSVPLLEIEQEEPGAYDPATVALIDGLVGLGEKHGIYIKFCLEHFRKITGAPAPFPSSVPFDKPVYKDRVASMEEYFSGETGKKLFLARASFLAERYGRRPQVFGWELWNEINAVSVAEKPLLLAWTTEMLQKVKEKSPGQLVMQTLGSYDSESQQERYRVYSALEGNEIAQAHRYLDQGAALPACQAPMDELAADAVRNLLSFALAKPVILSEVGAVEPNHAGPSKLYEKDSSGMLLHDLLFAPFFSGAAAPGQSWHWDYYIEKQDLWWHFSRFKEALGNFDPIAEKAKPFFSTGEGNLKIYGLKGTQKVLLWIRDGASDWKTELVAGLPPGTVAGRWLEPDLPVAGKVSFYDPWKGRWTSGAPGKRILLPEFSRSIIVKMEY